MILLRSLAKVADILATGANYLSSTASNQPPLVPLSASRLDGHINCHLIKETQYLAIVFTENISALFVQAYCSSSSCFVCCAFVVIVVVVVVNFL